MIAAPGHGAFQDRFQDDRQIAAFRAALPDRHRATFDQLRRAVQEWVVALALDRLHAIEIVSLPFPRE